ncbi:MAG: hypothetical protein JXA78_04240 [Anaerolineales bacterium]|nr:hypothetical protein [Anaerolineales bacterium]
MAKNRLSWYALRSFSPSGVLHGERAARPWGFAGLVCLLVVSLLSFGLLAETAWARSPWQQNIPPERVIIYHDVTDEYCGEGASWRDTITVWNVGALGGPQYEQAVWSYFNCENGAAVSYERDDGVFTGGPEGTITFPPRSGDEIKIGWALEDGKKAYFCFGGFEPWTVQNPQAFDAFYTTTAPQQPAAPQQPSAPGASDGLPAGLPVAVILVVLVGAGGAVVVGGAIVVKVVAGALKRPPAPPRRPPSPQPSDPEAAEAIRAWQQAAQQADNEAEEFIRQWETARQSGDPNDPGYQALEKKYQDYIQEQRLQAAEARRKAQEIEALEQQHQQELRQQQAYRRHRQAEGDFIERQRQLQAQRQGGFDRQVDQSARDNQQKLEQLKIKQKQNRLKRNKDLIETRMKVNQAEANMYQSFGQGYDLAVTGLEYVKAGADFAIDVCAEINPGAGKLVKTVYKVASGTGEGVGEAMVDPQNWAAHIGKGAAKGVVEVGADALKSGMVDGLLPQVRSHPIFSGVKMNTDPVRMSMFLEQPGRPAAILRGIFNAGLERLTDQVNPIIYGRDALKSLIGQ